ncbi:MAG: SOS response-associated peptidase [Bacteroidales bacterium]
MCYHYAIARTADEIALRYNIGVKPRAINPEPLFFHVNGFNYPLLPVVVQDGMSADMKLEFMQWGLVPGWVKGEEQAQKLRSVTLNARADTVHQKPSFRAAFRYRPCLVPATGYFEWMHYGNKKIPHYIFLPDTPVFSYAGIWEEWVNEQSGEILRSFSILTCDANELTSKIHNTKKRMPVILDQQSENLWFDNDIRKNNPGQILKPFDAGRMKAHTISRLITSRNQNSNVPEVTEPVEYPELN